ncbi:MAG: diaminopimelate dehydrogenase, partial [Oscillospiraceae bacterium]|nr:diaminopimelate dehydrogenase [Oscillospiraceae bacterium]
GWDPGLFSVQRATMQAVLPAGKTYTFWGRGVSQGHSDAIRRVPGVRRGVQYTVPIQAAMDAVRAGENPAFTARDMHERVCYVVPEAGADTARIEHDIVTMPNYFADYNTTVHFISEQEFEAKHTAMPHGGFVLRSGTTGLREAGDRVAGDGNKHLTEFSLTLQSNPAFTGSVLTAYARAVARLKDKGETGCRTALDIPAALLAEQDGETLRRELL